MKIQTQIIGKRDAELGFASEAFFEKFAKASMEMGDVCDVYRIDGKAYARGRKLWKMYVAGIFDGLKHASYEQS